MNDSGRPTSTRRRVLGGVLGAGAAMLASSVRGMSAPAGKPPLRLVLIGQSLIRHDLRARSWPDLEPIGQRLRSHHACFSNFEVVIRGPRAEEPTRDPQGVHAADPIVIDCLRDMGINLLATSNNHAFDLGTGGILDTMQALEERSIPFAGTGRTLRDAAAPVFMNTEAGSIALVSAAAGMIRPGGAATDSRAGVHELRRASHGGLEESDLMRMLESLERARAKADVVIAYLHNHLWENDIARTAEWQRSLARRAIEAGASVFVAHGPPLLQGIETFRGAPIFHGLGSFIFQTRKADDAYAEPNWESLIAECRFDDGRFLGAELVPLSLASRGERGVDDLETRGRPSIATSAQAKATLQRVAGLSQALGYRLRLLDDRRALLEA